MTVYDLDAYKRGLATKLTHAKDLWKHYSRSQLPSSGTFAPTRPTGNHA